jgi:hypothetical protein
LVAPVNRPIKVAMVEEQREGVTEHMVYSEEVLQRDFKMFA